MAVLSNSAGTPDDVGGAAADAIEEALGLPVLRRAHKKPRGFEDVAAHFKLTGGAADGSRLVMVGDRYFTDVVFGNAHGMLTVRTEPLVHRDEPAVVRAARAFERWYVGRLHRLGVGPPQQRFAHEAYGYLRKRD